MARLIFKEFDPDLPVYARKKFVANGHRYTIGNHFDWRKQAVSQRRVKQMYNSGLLRHDDQPNEMSIRAKKMVLDKEDVNNLVLESTVSRETMTEPEETPEAPVNEVTYPRHVGGPWYELSNGDRVRGQEAAQEAENGLDV